MSRTTLTVATASVLAILSIGLMIVRYVALGEDVKAPHGSWKVSMVVQGTSQGDARLMTAAPPDIGRQHIARERCQSGELLAKLPDARHPERHYVLWTRRGGAGMGPFRAHYEFQCKIDMHKPTVSMSKEAKAMQGPPSPGEYLDNPATSSSEGMALSTKAAQLTQGVERTIDQALALFRFVEQEIANEPALEGQVLSAADCLQSGAGDSGGKSRLLIALLRARGLPARMVTGLILGKGQREQPVHHWVEAWIDDQWLSYCPFRHHFEHVPPSYLILGIGDVPLVRGRQVADLHFAYLVERANPDDAPAGASPSPLRRWLMRLSLYMLPPAEQRLVEFLLLLPIAALMVCLYRNLIGLASFGTFAPALIGLAFRDLHSLPGMVVFVSIVLIGWGLRRVLNAFHLLQVPRTALLLTLVVVVLITAIVAANFRDLPATRYVALFPMVILTGMVERFWTLETEDSTTSSFKTLLGTIVIAASISLFLSLHAVVLHMFRYPETLGLVMAGQMLLGRYTGYRLSELYRFRDFLRAEPKPLGLYSEN